MRGYIPGNNDESAVPVEPRGLDTIGHGSKTVTTAGTPVQLSSTSVPCKLVVIQARTTNTGLIAVGASGVSANASSGTGVVLNAGDSFEIQVTDLNKVYIDSTANGESVRFTYFV